MRIVWVPQWTVLPVILEDQRMTSDSGSGGRLPSGSQPAEPLAHARPTDSSNPVGSSMCPFAGSSEFAPMSRPRQGVEQLTVTEEKTQYEFHVQNPTPQQQMSGAHPFSPPGQQAPYPMGRRQSQGAFSMAGMAGTLPDYHHQTPPQMPPYEQHQFQGQLSTGNYPVPAHQYSALYQDPGSAGGYGSIQGSHRSHSGGPSPNHSAFPTQYYPHQHQNFTGYPVQYGQMGHMSYPGSYAPATHQAFERGDMPAMGGRQHGGHSAGGVMQYPYPQQGQFLRPGPAPVGSRESSGSSGGSIPSTPRGPPRKPKQSGHALWVGNLPSGTVVGDLKDHFSQDATKDIESVFLISKSNCAFVNYRTEAACAAAMARFHDSRFQGVRLVCRLRRSSAPVPAASGVPTAPAALMPSVVSNQSAVDAITQNREVSSKAAEKAVAEHSGPGGASTVPDRYFIMKSLTVEDMELSVRNNIWATQAHNEDALNKAYKTAKNVFLIFSANKSGEYFGYARMASPIDEESSASLDWAPRGETVIDDPDIPRSIPTPATEHAPKGRIIDDSARGTIFWEASPDDEDEAILVDGEVDQLESADAAKAAGEKDDTMMSSDAQAFGKPFKIEWLATNRLPFYRTRGLRNPWNANREVKIARDGTELETSVGRRLVQMFQRSPTEPQAPMGYGPPRPY